MHHFRRYKRPAPPGSIVVRIVEEDGEPFGFIREIGDADDDGAHATEQKPIEQVWRLVDNKLQGNPHAQVYIETDANFEWRPEWGTLERR